MTSPEAIAEAREDIVMAREMVRQGNAPEAILDRLDAALRVLQPAPTGCRCDLLIDRTADLTLERLPSGSFAWLRPD